MVKWRSASGAIEKDNQIGVRSMVDYTATDVFIYRVAMVSNGYASDAPQMWPSRSMICVVRFMQSAPCQRPLADAGTPRNPWGRPDKCKRERKWIMNNTTQIIIEVQSNNPAEVAIEVQEILDDSKLAGIATVKP